jgi:hypothetical protein
LKQYGKLGTSVVTQNKQSNQADSSKFMLFILTWCKNSKQYTVLKESQLFLDEGMIPQRSLQKFWMYNPGKVVKYGLLVRMLHKSSSSSYICNMEIYTAEVKKLVDTILSVVSDNLEQNHHL